MKKKHQSFLERMYQDNHEGFLRFLIQKTKNTADAHEVLQEAFQKLMDRDGLDDMENPRAYLYRTAINIVIDRKRKDQHHTQYIREVSAGIITDFASGSHTIPADRHLSAKQELDAIYSLLDELPEKCRRSFVMHRVHNMKYSEIAEELKISVSMVEKYIIQALKLLRRRIKK